MNLLTRRHFFDRRLDHLGDTLDYLAWHSFLADPARQDPIQPEPAYLRYVVKYPSGKKPEDYLDELMHILKARQDTEGMVYLDLYLQIKKLEAMIEEGKKLPERLKVASEHLKRGFELLDDKKYNAAIDAFDQALKQKDALTLAVKGLVLAGKGQALARLHRHADALEVLARASQSVDADAGISWRVARAYAILGDRENALRYLAKAIQAEKWRAGVASRVDEFAQLKDDETFKALVTGKQE
jgi:tetratricopeptide (TPR) repeat protein